MLNIISQSANMLNTLGLENFCRKFWEIHSQQPLVLITDTMQMLIPLWLMNSHRQPSGLDMEWFRYANMVRFQNFLVGKIQELKNIFMVINRSCSLLSSMTTNETINLYGDTPRILTVHLGSSLIQRYLKLTQIFITSWIRIHLKFTRISGNLSTLGQKFS